MTSVLPPRWWAPEAPGIGPDDFDLRLLCSGSEPAKDLGQALLGLHRIGAAACEAVATQPLADETVLGAALAAAREMAVPPARDVVAKAVGGDARYGDLLLRDVLDDAEAAAVSLYRTCVAKHVAPPLAARRVGAVYGVPLRELGRYTAVAMDPKATQPVLDDAADRALFGYVAKFVDDESAATKITVSKAPAGEVERPATLNLNELIARSQATHAAEDAARPQTETGDGDWNPRDHPRGEGGRFSQLAHGEATASSEVGEAASGRTVGPATVGRQESGRGTLRRGTLRRGTLRRGVLRRGTLARPEVSEHARSTTQRAEVARSGTKRVEVARANLRRAGLTRQALVNRDAADDVLPAETSLIGMPRDVEDLLAARQDPNAGLHGQLDVGVSFVLPVEEYMQLRSRMGALDDGQLVFRAGPVTDYAGKPTIYDNGTGQVTDEHNYAVEHAAELAQAAQRLPAGAEKPIVVPLPMDLMMTLSVAQQKAVQDRAKIEFMRVVEAQLGRKLNRAVEISNVSVVPNADDPDQQMLVWNPPVSPDQPFDRSMVTVVSIVVTVDEARGVDFSHAGAKHRDVDLDPNMGLALQGKGTPGTTFYVPAKPGRPGYFSVEVNAARVGDAELSAAAKARTRGKPARRPFGKATDEASRPALVRLDVAALIARSQAAHAAEDAAWVETEHPRDERGQFSRGTLRRGTLRRGTVRRGTVQRDDTSRSELARSATERSTTRRVELTRSSTARSGTARATTARAALLTLAEEPPGGARPDPQTVFLDPMLDYTVLDDDGLVELLDSASIGALESAYEAPFRVSLKAASRLGRSADIVSGKDAKLALMTETDNRWSNLPWPNFEGLWKPVAPSWVINGEQDLSGIALELEEYLAKNPKQQLLHVIVHKDSFGYRVVVKTNVPRMRPASLVRYESDMKGPVRLRPEGFRRLTSAWQLEHWLQNNLAGAKGLGRYSYDQLPVPLVHTWVLEDDDRE